MKTVKSEYPIYVVVGVAILFSLLSPQLAQAATYCDSVQFIADTTVPDGTVFQAGEAFTKTWRLGNNGSCSWTTAYSLVYVSGDRLGAVETISLPGEIKPGFSVNLSVNMQAPAVAGHYRASWMLKNASGTLFGIGSSASQPFWVDINVAQADSAIYDFTTNAGYAQWLSGAGPLPFPGTSGDMRGYALAVDALRMEDGTTDTSHGLLTVPQNKFNGYIQATYPEIAIQAGDHFQTLVNCEYGAGGCYVTFRVDVITSAGRKTLWSWKEKSDGRYYRADIDLSAYAGKNVRFVFMLLASGDASNDRAIWGSPRILRGGGGISPLPTFTATPTPFAPAPAVTLSDCDKASLVDDVTVPFGTFFAPGAAFTKTWRLKNEGTCTWTPGYSLVFYSGNQMGGPASINVPWSVEPGQTVDLSVNMVAPPEPGTYRGSWALRNPSGTLFGIFVQGPMPILVDIEVTGSLPDETGYDFAANICSAQWVAGARSLPCPAVEGDSRGGAFKLDAPKLEDGSIDSSPGLLTLPQNKVDGYIMGAFPTFTVQPGDRFQAKIGCQYGATSCYVTFRLDYLTPGGTTRVFWTWKEKYEGKFYQASVDLSPLAGRSVRFVLTTLATGPATGDRALWGAPRIVRAAALPTVTPMPPAPPVVASPNIIKLSMLDPANGWAIGVSHILRTGDGGTTWHDVTPAGVSLSRGSAHGFFPSTSTGWVLTNFSEVSAGSLYYTSNGGSSWVHYDVPFGDGYIQFLDSAHGFVLSGQPSGMFKQAVSLYQTSDGGATWVRNYANDPSIPDNSLPFSGHKNGMVFRDGSHGWVGGDVPMNGFSYLYTTANSGVSWSQQPLALPAGYESAYLTIHAPKFFGASNAVLPVWMSTNTSRDLFIYTSRDGGASWARSSGVALQGKNTDFVSVNDGFTWNSNGFFQVTHNSGASWSQVTPNINFGESVQDMDFVSTTTGWILETDSNGNTTLYRTVNAGATWTLLHGPALPTATPMPAPSLTPTPTATSDPAPTETGAPLGPYAVWRVPPGGVLNIHSSAGAGNPVVGTFQPTATDVMLTVNSASVDGQTWAEVQNPGGGTGWVDSYYLTEYVTQKQFCADANVTALLNQFQQALAQSDGALLASLVSPARGLDVHLWSYQPAVHFTQAQVGDIFQDGQEYNWGTGPSANADIGTFAGLVQPQLLDVINNPNKQITCDDPSKAFPAINHWPDSGIHYYSLHKPGTPGVELDYRTWLVGFEYINHRPYLFALMEFVWEP